MKKVFSLILVLTMALALVGCGKEANVEDAASKLEEKIEEAAETVESKVEEAVSEIAEETEEAAEEISEEVEEVEEEAEEAVTMAMEAVEPMDYNTYMAAEVDTPVCVEAYIQGKQVYAAEYGNTSLYLADKNGAYFVYRLACTQEEYDAMEIGSLIKVTGYKSEWAGEVEIIDAVFEMGEGNWIAITYDATEYVGKDELINFQNQLVAMNDCTVESAAIYNWDGSGVQGDDLYINLNVNGESVNFTVETDDAAAADIYEAVEALQEGDKLNITCFMYWYEGANPHIQSIEVIQ